ncbi:MAG: SAM-dependent methyltransferase [Gammaproteobacteria bacterium CG_4_10_14_0_8_um_filter_38_16]|nr:MAG: SAM-dependent methyltransferase [Gammaproteobacteria bacterium CG_4_10_14_0_8_um_filter_38_16]PJA03154.1 MAG: SAM-dependent methyltransferase [Gammaproteobacteria bacterium CG_4_10_14_0_2_um_filter_38_22]PJB10537.1 MAG: SAM-dependent methyltransferase [Gammaproteobacteria bacterium CG_4_9_14_3_um_filter_38_9]
MPVTLPSPDPAAKALSDQLNAQIIAEINQTGKITFARYMALALYAPQLGYYRNGLKKFGKGGDFVTAPEISPLFSYCIANQCAQVLEETGGDIIEFGAGTGVMAADILLALEKKKQLPDHYYILELSAALQSQQRETIQEKAPSCLDRVVWLSKLPEKDFQGVVLANEVLDAMPVNLFTVNQGIKSCGVVVDGNGLCFSVFEEEDDLLRHAIEKYQIDFAQGYLSEINLFLPAWIKSIATFLSKGVVLLIDYGFPRSEYYHPDRSQGTLMCHYQHYAHTNPLILPGIQDITAHVDFTAVAEAADACGLSVAGYTNQAAFLMNCDLLSLIDQNADEITRFNQHQQIKQLTLPGEMGELFKVMALTKKIRCALMGFQSMSQLVKL